MALAILIIYGVALLFIFLYSLVQMQLVLLYLGKRGKGEEYNSILKTSDEKMKGLKDEESNRTLYVLRRAGASPKVTVQLPVYNEKYVVRRLLEAVVKMEYPVEKLEVQVLDDSSDDTSDIIREFISEYNGKVKIQHLQRTDRMGFKAGALAEGLQKASGEFIAIFDADFLPQPDFLLRTIPVFSNENIGMVQTRWTHINKDFSLLTKLQAFGLDAHFSVEQKGRNNGGHFINFNGTAGIWRKTCIEDAGGWQSDTLTEDLDLSYRAQLKGWKFHFMEDCEAPAELPAHMQALKTQQYRWTKGAAECSRKNLGKLLASNDFKMKTKLNAIFHLLNSSVFICILITSLLSLPILVIKHAFPEYKLLYNIAGFFLIGVAFLLIFYYTSFRKTQKKPTGIFTFLYRFPMFLSVSMGLSLHNGIAALEGLLGRKTPFVRTPKFNLTSSGKSWGVNQYVTSRIGKLTWLEILLAIYFALGIYLSIHYGDFGLLPFLLMLTFGYGYVAFLSVVHAIKSR